MIFLYEMIPICKYTYEHIQGIKMIKINWGSKKESVIVFLFHFIVLHRRVLS